MDRITYEGISPNLAFIKNKNALRPRERLLAKLLSKRDALRVICAPTGYGKSVLAHQYAKEVFLNRDVVWVEAASLSFLLTLDNLSSSELMDVVENSKDKQALYVFDACPHLSSSRFDALSELLDELLRAGNEVILTTSDTSWAEGAHESRIPVLAVCASELLLNDGELHEWGNSAGRVEETRTQPQAHQQKNQVFRLCQIPRFHHLGEEAQKAFWECLLDSPPQNQTEALAIMALLLTSGAVHELSCFSKSSASSALKLESYFPHCGIKRLSPMFQAVVLSDEMKFALLSTHLSALAGLLDGFDGEDALVEALVESLTRRGDISLATQLTCGLHSQEAKGKFFDKYALKFICDAQPLSLLRLANSLSQEEALNRQRMVSIIVAYGMIGDTKNLKRALDSYQHAAKTVASSDTSKAMLVNQKSVFCFAMRVLFDLELSQNPQDFEELVALGIAHFEERKKFSSAKPDFTQDMFQLVSASLKSPQIAIEALERMLAAGHAITESLFAAALFVQFLIHFWSERAFEIKVEHEGNRSLIPLNSESSEVLSRLERVLSSLLARQETVLGPNCFELFLGRAARRIFGDQAFLFMSDGLLSRIEQTRESLHEQQKQWLKLEKTLRGSVLKPPNAPQRQARPPQGEALKPLPAHPTAMLRINTLGRFEIETFNPSVSVNEKVRKQLRMLISLLAIHEGREVSRPWVQRIMWPDAPERNAKQNLYSMWSLLNKSITNEAGECPFFESFPHSLALNESLVETDIRHLNEICKRLRERDLDFGEYEQALEELEGVYRGPLLPGIDAAEVVAQRKRFQDQLLEALIKGGLKLRKQGKTSLALRYFRFAFANEPTREDVCYQVMFTLWKLGRHGEALNEYFVCRRALIDQFGVEGSTRLRDLYESILHDAS